LFTNQFLIKAAIENLAAFIFLNYFLYYEIKEKH
jgi:hypothetical protein